MINNQTFLIDRILKRLQMYHNYQILFFIADREKAIALCNELSEYYNKISTSLIDEIQEYTAKNSNLYFVIHFNNGGTITIAKPTAKSMQIESNVIMYDNRIDESKIAGAVENIQVYYITKVLPIVEKKPYCFVTDTE